MKGVVLIGQVFWAFSCLKQGQVCKPSVAALYQNMGQVPPLPWGYEEVCIPTTLLANFKLLT